MAWTEWGEWYGDDQYPPDPPPGYVAPQGTPNPSAPQATTTPPVTPPGNQTAPTSSNAMSEAQVAQWLRDQGVSEGVIKNEAGYVASKYADPDEDPLKVLNQSLPFYLQRTLSGGDRNNGGYSTDLNDPAITRNGYTAPARTDSAKPLSGAAGASGWFAANGIGAGGGAGGFGETYTAPGRPGYLQGPYTPPTWDQTFTAPSVDDLKADPGYKARMDASQRGFEHSAAAQGKVLSGGFVGRTLPKALQEQASNEYANVYGRAFDTYRQKYGQFQDAASLGQQARTTNENAYQADVSNGLNQYNTRYRAYDDSVKNNLSFARLGLDAATAGRP